MNWYRTTSNEEGLKQCDIILNCPIIIPPNSTNPETWKPVTIEYYDVIIMSQSCDLQHDKIKLVLVAPIFSLANFSNANNQFKDYKLREAMRLGNLPGYHLLNSYNFETREDLKDELLVVDFKSIFSVNIDFLKAFTLEQKELIGLKSPYIEHLAQAFARFLMRVGLPSTLPRFTKK